MKTLILVRHAKSSWTDASVSDFDRKLNDRGKHDAPVMAKRLAARELTIDAFISSPAKRAKKTAEIFTVEFKNIDIQLIPQLYEASLQTWFAVIENLDDQYNTVAVFAHNPAITDFVNAMDVFPVFNIPTCGIYALKIHTNEWSQLQLAGKEFLFFDYPKNGKD